MHVECEGGRRAALAERLVRDGVIEQAGALAAPFPADGQREKALLAQAIVVLDGMAGVAVVRRRAGREIRRQLAALLLQPLLFAAEREIHSVPFR